jgi:ribonuclease VapC
MVVDSSALVAALTELDGELYVTALAQAPHLALSAVNAYETRLVLRGRKRDAVTGAALVDSFAALLARARVAIVPFDADQAILAHDAYLRFGKGFHPADLNFADCAAYALARLRGEPLLFKGGDFALTDITSALA